jgi:hypothetical protein
MNRFASTGETAEPYEQQYPRLGDVRLHRFDDEIPGHTVEELLHVEVNDPGISPAALPARRHRIEGRALRSIAIGVGVEDRLDLLLDPPRHDRLRHPVGDSWYSENPGASTMGLWYRHRSHRGREVTARGHPVPDPIEIVLQIGLELLERHLVDTRCTLVGLYSLKGLPHLLLGDLERLS